jgi:hypothetical protein
MKGDRILDAETVNGLNAESFGWDRNARNPKSGSFTRFSLRTDPERFIAQLRFIQQDDARMFDEFWGNVLRANEGRISIESREALKLFRTDKRLATDTARAFTTKTQPWHDGEFANDKRPKCVVLDISSWLWPKPTEGSSDAS